MKQTIDIRPTPKLIRDALKHSEIPLKYNDDHTVSISAQGWDHSEMVPNNEMQAILSAIITQAMVKHMEDTMILPSNVDSIRRVVSDLRSLANDPRELSRGIEEYCDDLERVADNLDPAKR